jgi:AraC-like DNA-binding protein/ABC-type glycerol-3-phosphate transport system substrate-binding protein
VVARRRPGSIPTALRLGAPGLDELVGGALAPGAALALSGPPQSGKTWLAVQFLLAAEPGDSLLHVRVSPRKEAREELPLASRLREQGHATLQNERLNRPVTPWLNSWLERVGRDARVAIEVAADIDELSPRESIWVADAHRELRERGVTSLVTLRAPGAEPRVITAVSKLFPDAHATLVLELRSSEWGLERQLLVAGVKGAKVPSRYHVLELGDDGVRLAADSAVPAEATSEAESPLFIGAPPYLQGPQKRLYVQRVRRHLETEGGPGVKPVHGRPFFSQLLGELYAPRTDFGAVLVSEPGVVRHLAEKGLLMALEGVFPEHAALFIDKALRQASFFGHLFAVPQHVSVRVLMYRADLLRKHGLEPPRTWDEVESQASYVLRQERDPDLAGLTFEYRPSVRLGLLLDHVWATGDDLYSGDIGSFTLNRKRVVEALTRLRRLVDEKRHTRLSLTPSEHWDTFQRFFAGKSLFLQHWSDGLRLIHERGKAARAKFGWCALPTSAPGVVGHALAAGVSYVVPKNTRHPVAARHAIRRLTEPEFLARMEPQFGWPFPASALLYDDPRVLEAHPFYADAHDLLARSRLLEEAPYLAGDPFEWTRVAGEALGRAFRALRPDAAEPEEIAEALEEGLGALLPKPAYSGLSARAVDLIERELHQSLTGEILAEKLGVSRPHLAATFRRHTGRTLHDYLTERRIARARELLHHSELNVGEIASRLGYKTIFHFSRVFKRETGVSPRQYRNRTDA